MLAASRWKKLAGLLLSVVFFGTGYVKADTQTNSYPLDFYTEIYPPSAYIKDGQLTGLSVETLRLVWQQLNITEPPIWVVPWARGYVQVQRDRHTVLFAMSRSTKREKQFKWVGPIFTAHYLLVSNNNNLDNNALKSASFALIRDDITEELLLQLGVKNLVESANMQQAEQMLASKRIDMLAISASGLRDIFKQQPDKINQYKVVCKLASVGDYFAFNRNVPESVISKYQQAMMQLSSQIKQLRIKYKVDDTLNAHPYEFINTPNCSPQIG